MVLLSMEIFSQYSKFIMSSLDWDSSDDLLFDEPGSDPFRLPEFELSDPDDVDLPPPPSGHRLPLPPPPSGHRLPLPPPPSGHRLPLPPPPSGHRLPLPPPPSGHRLPLPPPPSGQQLPRQSYSGQWIPPPPPPTVQRIPPPPSTTGQSYDPLTIVKQPPDTWYQFNEGNIPFMFHVSSNIDPESVLIKLAYADTLEVVGDDRSIKVYDRLLTDFGSYVSIDCAVKIREISKNHQKRQFTLLVSSGIYQTRSTGFSVKTKRTKRKAFGSIRPRTEDQFKRQARHLLRQLEWTIGGYESSCQGYVDMNRPIYECPICKNRKTNGHTTDCSLRLLL